MKRTLITSIAWLALFAPRLATAWTYNDGDVLLIFRESGFNDVEFNLGNVSQFLNKASGYTNAVSGWDRALVTNTFGADLTGVSVILTATTTKTDPNRAAWLTSGDPSASVHDLTASTWQSDLWSIINAVGSKPVAFLLPAAGASAYSIDPNGTTKVASYDYIVSPTGNFIPQFGGHANFTVEGIVPGTFGFWQIQPSASIPKPPSSFIGTFTLSAGGTLIFKAGPVATVTPPSIVGLGRAGNIATVSFNTTIGGNYWLAYTNTLGAPISTWGTVSGPITGDGNNHSLTHTNSGVSGFYGIVRTP